MSVSIKQQPQRPVRPVERQSMREWLTDKLDSKEIPGLEWVHIEQKIFKIKWCHGSQHSWSLKDSVLFEKWAQHSGRHQHGDPKRWKANFRCALNSLKDVEEVKSLSVNKGSNAFKVYKMLDHRKKSDKTKTVKKKIFEPTVKCVYSNNKIIKVAKQLSTVSARDLDFDHDLGTKESSDVLADSESEGYQTDKQEDSCMELSTDSQLTVSSASHVSPRALTSGAESSAAKTFPGDSSSKTINIPNFDKIIPDFYKIEFGKNHLLPRHCSGFKVDLLKHQEPLLPSLQRLQVPLHRAYSASLTGSLSYTAPSTSSVTQKQTSLDSRQTPYFSLSSAQINSSIVTNTVGTNQTSVSGVVIEAENDHCPSFPETPDGSETSRDSQCEEAIVEVAIYEEVSDTPMSSVENCIILTDLGNSVPVSLPGYLDNQGPSGTQLSSTVKYFTYNPLTPPE